MGTVDDDKVFQVVFHPVLKDPLIKWLASVNIKLVRLPAELGDTDELPTYGITPMEL